MMNLTRALQAAVLGLGLILTASAPAMSCATNVQLPFTATFSSLWIHDLLFSPDCRFIYASNSSRNVIEILSIASGQFEAPITVRNPGELDISPDGKTLYVISNSAAISEIDLTTRRETRRLGAPADERLYVPPFYTSPQFFSLVVAHDGVLFVSLQAGASTAMESPTFWLAKSSGAENRLVLVEAGPVGFKASRDRKLIYAGSASNLWRYTAETGNFSPVGESRVGVESLNEDGSVGVGGVVINARSAPIQVLGALPYRSQGYTTAYGMVVNGVGSLAYQVVSTGTSSPLSFGIEVFDLKTFTNIARFPIDAPYTLTYSNPTLKLSPGDRMIAVNNRTSIVLMHAERPESIDNRITVLSRRNVPRHSVLRFHNTGDIAGRASVILTDFNTGAVVSRWQSPEIPAGASSEFYIADMEGTVSDPLALPLQYIARYSANFPGTLSHVTRQIGGGPVTNASTCDTRVNAPGNVLANVHSTRAWSDSPSEIRLTNTGKAAASFSLGIFNSHTGGRLGTYNVGVVNAGTARAIAMSLIERTVDLAPPDWLQQYTVKLEGEGTGELQHLVYHPATGVLSDMTPICILTAR